MVWVRDQRRSYHPCLPTFPLEMSHLAPQTAPAHNVQRADAKMADPGAAAPGVREKHRQLVPRRCSRLHGTPSVAIRQTLTGVFAAGGAAREFPAFPFTPYAIQQQFMTALYDTLQQGGVGILESPTGTVRIPSRLCAGRPPWPPNPCGVCSVCSYPSGVA